MAVVSCGAFYVLYSYVKNLLHTKKTNTYYVAKLVTVSQKFSVIKTEFDHKYYSNDIDDMFLQYDLSKI